MCRKLSMIWIFSQDSYIFKYSRGSHISRYSRDSYMHHTWKGIYLKFRSEGGTISNILYENILMDVRDHFQNIDLWKHISKESYLILIIPSLTSYQLILINHYIKYRRNNLNIKAPEQWAIWIGPAQQAVSSNLCNPAPCRLIFARWW